jgi:hypothetical protein
MRYGLLFSEIDAQEKMAQAETAAGHADAAASWHSFLATQSGLAPESAEIVKKIGAEYLRKAQALQQERIRVTIAVRHANPGAHMSRFNSPEIAKVEQEIDALLPSVKLELIQALGPKAFTQLDSYTLHSHDRTRRLDPSALGPNSSVQNVSLLSRSLTL